MGVASLLNSFKKFNAEEIFFKATSLAAFIISAVSCMGLNSVMALPAAVIGCLLLTINSCYSFFSFLICTLISLYLIKTYGFISASFSIALCGIMLIISGFVFKEKKISKKNSVLSALYVPVAFSVTALITTDYFGIGATGNTVFNMLKSYVSLGFHPNWRGILYGTIVMVVMITFPRKFKSFSKKISAAFCAIVITSVLNLWLIPEDSVQVIQLVNKPDFSVVNSVIGNFDSLLSFACVADIILSAFALYIICTFCSSSYSDELKNVGFNSLFSGLLSGICIPGQPDTIKEKSPSRFISALICTVSLLIFVLWGRIPLASCAVILIVGAWQSVNWSSFIGNFKHISGLFAFVFSFILSLFFNISISIIFLFCFEILLDKRKCLREV